MTSRDSTQVRPAETNNSEQGKKKDKYTLNFFEVLEDRYAYEGFNKFAFYLDQIHDFERAYIAL